MLHDYVNFAVKSIRNRKTRSLLTIVGVVIGVAAVISLMSVSQGMQEAIRGQLEDLGQDKVMIMPGSIEQMGDPLASGPPGMMAAGRLTEDDVKSVLRVRGVESVLSMYMRTALVTFGRESEFATVVGVPVEPASFELLKSMEGYKSLHGRHLDEHDRYNVNIGYGVAYDVFDREVGLRSKVIIEGIDFKVVGIMEKMGNKYDDGALYMPIKEAREIFNEPDMVSTMLVKVKEGFSPDLVADNIEEKLKSDRGLGPNDKADFSVETSQQLMEKIEGIMQILQTVLVGIAAISLLVGGVGIMSTMYTAILERTREIGIMKAIGAKNSSILMIFLLESGIIGLIGGAAGCLLGAGIARAIQASSEHSGSGLLRAYVTPELIIMGLALSFFLGMLSGFLPARSASKLKPVDALRYE